ncbi:MAG: hypothetical protein HYU64_16575 [Armatimonadetes bacterium]|nr:hypothetical protein [Armatimonadota bacterium]
MKTQDRFWRLKDIFPGALILCFRVAGWGGGGTGPQGPAGAAGSSPSPTNTQPVLSSGADLPGVVPSQLSLSGGSGPEARGRGPSSRAKTFVPGDTISVTFTLKKSDGTSLALSEMNSGGIMVSGPSSNYQKVIAYQSDLLTRSTQNSDGSYTYKFASPIPSTYAAPDNDSTAFGASDGELQGQALSAGTYTVGMQLSKAYTIGTRSYTDVGNISQDFLLGGAVTLEPREVVKNDNCNRCHANIRAHDGTWRDVKLCILCHTSGAEDKNEATVEGGTPGVSMDFRVLIHKIHNGKYLPSVNGVSTKADGTRDYGATPRPYKVVGDQNTITDYSAVGSPIWLNWGPMPRDAGYSSLTAAQKTTDDTIRTGIIDCNKCHGDPDGSGALTAPSQGDNAYSKPTRRACDSCHDDILWAYPYSANNQTQPAQGDDTGCTGCHASSGAALSVTDSHKHPRNDTALFAGLNVNISNVTEGPGGNGNGKIDAGEKIQVSFTITNDSGANVTPLPAGFFFNAALSGPTSYTTAQGASSSNANGFLHFLRIGTATIGTGPNYTMNLPEIVMLEYLGRSTAALDVFTTSRAPHRAGTTTTVLARTATAGGNTTLSVAATINQVYVDVNDVTNFARGDYVVIEDLTANEEYLRIQYVDTAGGKKRLWFTSPAALSGADPTTAQGGYGPWLRVAHANGASIKEVTLTKKTSGTQYTLNSTTGQITEVAEFGNGNAVLVVYTSDFVMPARYPPSFNDSPTFDETWGKWSGKDIVSGTYRVGLFGFYDWNYALYGETTTYTLMSPPAVKDFLVGTATAIVASHLDSFPSNCETCHNDIIFHGQRRGFQLCFVCHASACWEDRPKYVAANAPDTTDTTPTFRTMIHKIHRGKELANASTYTVVGFATTAYPNNYATTTFGDLKFPPMPGTVKHCNTCHGASNTWKEPSDRSHPTQQVLPLRQWNAVCGSCHDSNAAQAHIALNTSAGSEACATCHGQGKEFNVELVHKNR